MEIPTPIADMVTEMLKNCIPMEAIIMSIRSFERAMSTRHAVDETAERRRAWDRARKAKLPADWSAIAQSVFKRDEYRCTYCGDEPGDLHCDHIIPLSRGGSSHMDNLTSACESCNLDKGNKLLSEWPFYQEYVQGLTAT
jgi:5-methylcytosine-specific restriction endonuclease McrA